MIEKVISVWSKVKYVVVLLIAGVVLYRLVQEIRDIDIKKSIFLFKELNTSTFILIILLGIIGILILSLYDIVLKRTIHVNTSYKKLIPFSFITNALNNILGFGGLIGSGLRYYFYKNKTEDTRTLKAISLMLLSLITGLGFLSLLIVFHVFPVGTLESNFKYTKPLVYLMAIGFIVFIIATIMKPVIEESRLYGVKLAGVSILDWFFASGILFFILKTLHIDVPYGVFLGVFTVAALVGLLSMIPGGFGAFDLVMLLGLASFGLGEETLVLALLLYRISYYLAPFVVALVLSIGEFKYMFEALLDSQAEKQPYTVTLLKDGLVLMPHFITGVLTFVTGVVYMFGQVLILYNTVYGRSEHEFYIIFVVNVAACFIIIVSSLGVQSGSRRATLMAMFGTVLILVTAMLSFGTVLSVVWLITLFVLLIIGYNNSRVLARVWTPTKAFFVLAVFIFMMFYNNWVTEFILETHRHTDILKMELFLTVTFVIVIVSALVNTIISYQVHRGYSKVNRKVKDEVIRGIIDRYQGDLLSHLAFSGDKSFFINDEETAFIMYKRVRNTIIVLGDPIGDRSQFVPLLERFYDQILYIGYDVVFYQVQDKNLPLYHDFGNVFFKLGEEALVPLVDFTLQGKKQRAFRSTMNRLEKEGYTFSVIEPPFFEEDIKACRLVSKKWLEGRSEMHFSVGKFDTYYLRQAPIGIIRNSDKEIVAFTSFMPVNDSVLSVDLIRWDPEETLPMMDALYLNMLLYAKEHGYEYFNMGMATLSNVGQNKYGYIQEKIAGIVFEKGSTSYNFTGLRHYKEKFKPVWEERFLVYRRYSSVLMSLFRVIIAIRKA